MKFLPSIQEDKQEVAEVAGKSAMCVQTPLEKPGPSCSKHC